MAFQVKLKTGDSHVVDVETAFTLVKVEREYGLTVAEYYAKLEGMSMEVITFAFWVNLAAHKITDKSFTDWLFEDFEDFDPVEDDETNPKDQSQAASVES